MKTKKTRKPVVKLFKADLMGDFTCDDYYFLCSKWLHKLWEFPKTATRIWLTLAFRPGKNRVQVVMPREQPRMFLFARVEGHSKPVHVDGLICNYFQVRGLLDVPVYVGLEYEE